MQARAVIWGAPASPREPPATSTWPEVNLCQPGARLGRRPRAAAVSSPIGAATGAPRGMPMSATCTSPACCLPGAIHRPGLAAWKVTVAAARTAAPATTPVEACTPLGTSTLMTGVCAWLIASIAAATSPRGSPSKPVPSRASTTALQLASGGPASPPRNPASPRCASCAAFGAAPFDCQDVPSSLTGPAPGSRWRLVSASPESSDGGATQTTLTRRPASRRRRAATNPSPPLLPLPHTIVTSPSGASRSAARATAAPARSIRSRPGTPCSSIAQRSIARIADASGSGVSHPGRDSTAWGAPCLLDGDGLGEVARLVDVESPLARDGVGEQLQRDHGEDRLQHPVACGHRQHRVHVRLDDEIAGGGDRDHACAARACLLDVGDELVQHGRLRRHADDGSALVEQGDGAVLH